MPQSRPSARGSYQGVAVCLILSGVLPVAADLFIHRHLYNSYHYDEIFHAVLESSGAVVALILAALLWLISLLSGR